MLPPDDRPAAHSTSRPVDARRPRAHAAHPGRRLGDRLAPPPLPDEGGGRSLPAPLSLRAQRPVRSGAPAAHPRRSSRLPAHHLPLRGGGGGRAAGAGRGPVPPRLGNRRSEAAQDRLPGAQGDARGPPRGGAGTLVPRPRERSEEHTSELQSPCNLVCRLLLEKKKKIVCKKPGRLAPEFRSHMSTRNTRLQDVV